MIYGAFEDWELRTQISKTTNYSISINWTNKSKTMNDILYIPFLKSIKKSYRKWNYRYKGIHTANLYNAVIVYEYLDQFINWLKENELNLITEFEQRSKKK